MEPARLALYAGAVVQAYLLGAIPFGYLLARYVAGIDVRSVGSGNIGATNVGRAAGVKLGLAAFVLDLAKGLAGATVIPFSMFVIAGGKVDVQSGVVRSIFTGGGFTDLKIACAFAAVAGHVWPVFLGFRGGKGVATGLGAMIGLAPAPTLAAFGVWAVTAAVFRYVSLASITAAAALPLLFAAFERADLARQWRLFAAVILVAAIVVWRHRGNIRRLVNGTENRISFNRGPSP